MDAQDHSKIIDLLGGTTAVAKECCVRPQAVSKWRREGIPPARMLYLKAVHADAFEGIAGSEYSASGAAAS